MNGAHDSAPPHDLEAERAVLGAMMLDQQAAAAALGQLEPGDFYRTGHRHLFTAIGQLFDQDKPPDELLVREQLQLHGNLDAVGGMEALREIGRDVTSGAFVDHHIQMVRDMATRRRLIHACNATLRGCYDSTLTTDNLVDQVESAVMDATAERNTEGPKPFSVAVDEALAEVERETAPDAPQVGLECGHSNVDLLTGGWRKGEFIILAGRPSDGKTSLGLNWSVYAAEWAEAHVLWFSLEMPRRQIARNALSMLMKLETHTNQVRLLDDVQLRRLRATAQGAKALPLEIDDAGTLSISALRARARRSHLNWPLDLIVVDYLTLVTGPRQKGASRAEEVGNVSKGLKRLARELDVPVMAMAQLRRDADGRQPRLNDLRESGDIEQDADKVLFIWRDKQNELCRKVTVAKNRSGPTGTIMLRFDAPEMTYVQLSE